MAVGIVAIPGVVPASRLVHPAAQDASPRFSFPSLRGRLSEVLVRPGTPALSVVSLLVREAQECEEPVGWISTGATTFYPPDFEKNGVAVGSIPFITAVGVQRAFRATEHLLRAAVFGLIVVDLETPGTVKPGRLGTLNRLAAAHDSAVLFLNSGCPATHQTHRSAAPRTVSSRSTNNHRGCGKPYSRSRDSLNSGCPATRQGPPGPAMRSEGPARHTSTNPRTLGSLISLRVVVELEHPAHNRFLVRIRTLKDRRVPEGWVQELEFRGTDGLY